MQDSSAMDRPVSASDGTAGERWNPRFVAYAKSHGRSPAEQLAHDAIEFPGGKMAGFLVWNRRKIVEFSHANPAAFCLAGLLDHEAYNAWLLEGR